MSDDSPRARKSVASPVTVPPGVPGIVIVRLVRLAELIVTVRPAGDEE